MCCHSCVPAAAGEGRLLHPAPRATMDLHWVPAAAGRQAGAQTQRNMQGFAGSAGVWHCLAPVPWAAASAAVQWSGSRWSSEGYGESRGHRAAVESAVLHQPVWSVPQELMARDAHPVEGSSTALGPDAAADGRQAPLGPRKAAAGAHRLQWERGQRAHKACRHACCCFLHLRPALQSVHGRSCWVARLEQPCWPCCVGCCAARLLSLLPWQLDCNLSVAQIHPQALSARQRPAAQAPPW